MTGYGWHRLAAFATAAAFTALGACSGTNGNGDEDTSRVAMTGDTAAGAERVATGTAPAAAIAPGAAAAATTALQQGQQAQSSDAEILQILAAVDQGEIQAGQLAERQAHSSQVKSYARTLVNDHSASLQKSRQIAKAEGIRLPMSDSAGGRMRRESGGEVMRDSSGRMMRHDSMGGGRMMRHDSMPGAAGAAGMSSTVSQLMMMHRQTMQHLRSMQGAAFDSAYVNAEVTGHQQALSTLQGAQPQDAKVKQQVASAVKIVQAHLMRGEKLQQSLSSGGKGMSDSMSRSKTRTRPDTGR